MNSVAITPEQSKRLATLTAQLALRGFSVYEVVNGGFFVARCDGTRYCPAIADLEAFAVRVGAVA